MGYSTMQAYSYTLTKWKQKLFYSQFVSAVIVFLLSGCFSVWANTSLSYQNRGDRYEGIKAEPISGFHIELVSVLAHYQEKTAKMPDSLKLSFYLPTTSDVYVTVRELDNQHYYWMDRLRPQKAWQAGFNHFSWSTKAVLAPLHRQTKLAMYDLGVVARIGSNKPLKEERVAPVIFFHNQLPKKVNHYLFAFKTNSEARVQCSLFKQDQLVTSKSVYKAHADRPVVHRWDASTATAGYYKLLIKGYFMNSSQPIYKAIHFYHQPNVK